MIAVVIIWCVIALVCTGLGLLFTKTFLEVEQESGPSQLIYNAIAGMSILIPLLAIFSLVVRINGELLALFCFVSCGIILSQRRRLLRMLGLRDFNWLFFSGVLIMPLLLLLYYAVLNPGSIGDTLLYHAQCIQWTEKYKAIKGLAHIHNRLAFNNHSLLPFSLFGFSFTNIQTFYCVNSFLMLLMTLKCGIGITKAVTRQRFHDLIFYVSILLGSFFLIGERVASPAPDNSAAIYLIFCIILFKEIIKDGKKGLLPLLYLMAFLLPTIKVSTVFVAVLPVLASLKFGLHKQLKHWLYVVGVGVFTVFPYFARNMILSGYLVFPLPLDLFNFDWQYFDTARLEMMNKYIINAARITGPHDPGLWTYDMSIREWFPHWLTWRTPQYYYMNVALPLCLIFTIGSLLMGAIKRAKADFFYLCFGLFFAISFLYWLFSAPDFRFIWGTLISGVSIIGYFLFEQLGKKSKGAILATVALTLLFTGVIAYKSVKFDKAIAHIKLPIKIKEIEVKPQQFGPIAVNIPSSKKLGGLCYNALIPCTHHIHDTFEARGSRIIDGFRMNPSLKKKKKKDKKLKKKPQNPVAKDKK